jgi:hypothetical protein
LDSEFGESNNEKVDDFLNGLRLYLRDRGIKIAQDELEKVEITFPTLLVSTPTKNAPLLYGDKSKKNQKEEGDKLHEEQPATTIT